MQSRFAEKCISLFLAIIFSFSWTSLQAYADENETDETACYTLDGKNWDELIEEFYDSHYLKAGYFSFGYYNTVTGETHFYNEDRWFIGASIFKLPLGMLYAEMLEGGEISLENEIQGIKLEKLLSGMIVNSSNEYAEYLWRYRGSYNDMRRDFLKYFNMDEENVEDIYWRNNYFTAAQMLSCLRYLYENSDTYAPVIDRMLIASPDRNFKSKEQEFEIAHKYGYVPTDYASFYNDTAICYTDDPICIVMLTEGVYKPSSVLADFCTLACDYAQSSREQRLKVEEERRIEEEAKALEEQREAEAKAAEEKKAEEARLAEEKRLEAEKKAEADRMEAEKQQELEAREKKHRLILAISGVIIAVVFAESYLHLRKRKKQK